MANRQTVRLDDLGSLRVSSVSDGYITPEEMTTATIKREKVIFTPSKSIKNTLKTLELKK